MFEERKELIDTDLKLNFHSSFLKPSYSLKNEYKEYWTELGILHDLKGYELVKSYSFSECKSYFTRDNNIFALLGYLIYVIEGAKHNTKLDPCMIHLVTNVEYKIFPLFGRGKGDGIAPVCMCKFLMYYYGIGYKKDVKKAMQYLFANARNIGIVLKSNLKHIIPLRIYKSVFQYYRDAEFYSDYLEIFNDNWFNEMSKDFFDSECLYWIFKVKKDLLKVDIAPILYENDMYEPYLEVAEKAFADIYLPYKEQKEKEYHESIDKERQENEKKLQEVEEVKSEPVKEYTAEEIAVLEEKTDDLQSMAIVANYYFRLASNNLEDQYHYMSAIKYYTLAAKLGGVVGWYNVGICYTNLSNKATGDKKEEYANKAIDVLKEHAKEYFGCAINYYLYYYRNKPKGFRNEADAKIAEDIYMHYKNGVYKENLRTYVYAAYMLYLGDFRESLNSFNKIREEIKNSFVVAEEYLNTYVNRYIVNYEVGDFRFPSEEEVREMYMWGVSKGRRILEMTLAEYKSRGNIVFPVDKEGALKLLKKHQNNFGADSAKYTKILNELEKKA